MSGLASPGAEGPDWEPTHEREPEPDHEPAPSPLADAEQPGPIQMNTSAITSPTRSPVLSEERLSSRRHCS